MARDDPHFRLRVSEELRERIAEAAKANNRSMNAEIVARLEMSLQGGLVSGPALDGYITGLAQQLISAVGKAMNATVYGVDASESDIEFEKDLFGWLMERRILIEELRRYEIDAGRLPSRPDSFFTEIERDRALAVVLDKKSKEEMETRREKIMNVRLRRSYAELAVHDARQKKLSEQAPDNESIESLREQMAELDEKLNKLKS